MRLDNERPSANVEDQRGQGGFANQGSYGERMGFPGGGTGIPIGIGRGGFSLSTIIVLVIVYFAFKLLFGIDLVAMMNGGDLQQQYNGSNGNITVPSAPINKSTN